MKLILHVGAFVLAIVILQVNAELPQKRFAFIASKLQPSEDLGEATTKISGKTDIATGSDELEVVDSNPTTLPTRRNKRFIIGLMPSLLGRAVNDFKSGGVKQVKEHFKQDVQDVKAGVKATIKFVKKVSRAVGEFTVDTVKKVARFTKTQVKKIKKGVVGVYKFAKAAFKATYDAAKKVWESAKNVLKKIPFKKILDVLLNLLVDAVTIIGQEACEHFCEISFESIVTTLTAIPVVGSIAAFFACPPLCEAAIATIKDYIGLSEYGYLS